jgi:hypothetical protein
LAISFRDHIDVVIPMRDCGLADLEELPGSWARGWGGRAPRWTSQTFEGRSTFERRIKADLERDGKADAIVHVYLRRGHFDRQQAGELLTGA